MRSPCAFSSDWPGYPTQDLHLVVDNDRTHKHPAGRARGWQTTLASTSLAPIGAAWMKQVETRFSVLHRRAIAVASSAACPQLVAAIGRFLTGRNKNSRPFAWIKRADVILAEANRIRTP
jgi:hypothetical protein